MKLKWRALGVLPFLLLAGCGGAPKNAANPTDQPAATDNKSAPKRLRIAVIPKMLNNPVFGYARIGAERAAKELGNVDIEFTGPQRNDPVQQASTIDAMVAKRVDGILVSCADPDIPRKSIDKATAAGIKVLTFDSDSPKSQRLGYYGVIDEKLGNRLGQEIARLLNNKGRIAILSGAQGALNLQNRVKGVRDALAKSPGIQIIDTYYCNDDLPKSEQIVSNVTRSQKPDGWVFVGGWPLFVKSGLNAITPGKTKVVSADPLPETWKWIEGNYVQVCLGQKVFGWGEEGTRLLVKALKGETIPTINDSGFDVVTPQSLAQYKKQWAEMSKES
ncbi:MAG TPA: substrate-binding domain-containing protein [Abditibacteriaceae bacterium]|nr:substrate-binding domain-containing protein [Abditibacteriaceae bacterium]